MMLTLSQRVAVIQSILRHINADKIYLNTLRIAGIEAHYATVTVNTEIRTDIQTKLYHPVKGHKEVLYAIYRNDQIQQEISNGNVFLLTICSPANLIYSEPDSATILPLSDLKAEMQIKAIIRFRQGMGKVNSFIRGAVFYQQNGEQGLSAFMLHQATEITYRTLGMTLIGKERRSHELQLQQDWLSNLIPHLPIAFDTRRPEESDLLQLLNASYSSVRYETSYAIDEVQLLRLFNRVEYLVENSIALVEDLLSITNIPNRTKIMSIPVNNDLLTRANYLARMNRAKVLMKAGESLVREKHQEVSTTLFAQCMTQVCIAIIGLYNNGYQAENLSLPNLLDLCQSHWPNQYLENQRKELKYHALYQLLYKTEHPPKYHSGPQIQSDEVLAIYRLCKDFFSEANVIGIHKLDDLEQFKP